MIVVKCLTLIANLGVWLIDCLVYNKTQINSLALGDLDAILKMQFSLLFYLLIGIFTSSKDNAVRWMPWDLTNEKSTLVQVMAWCRQATSHYLSQCWPSSMSPYGVTRPQWVNTCFLCLTLSTQKVHNTLIDQSHKPHNAPVHIPQYTIQNRNVHISVLNDVLWDMGQVHCGICELGLLLSQDFIFMSETITVHLKTILLQLKL